MRIEIHCQNRLGMVHEILDLFLLHQIDLQLIEVGTHSDQLYVGMPDIEFGLLQPLLSGLRRIKGVHDVKIVHFTPTERTHYATRHLLDAMPDGVLSVDLKNTITFATKQAAIDVGLPFASIIGQKLENVIPSLAKMDWSQLGTETIRRIRLNGQLVLTEVKTITIPNDDGEPILAGGVVYLKSAKRLDKQQARLHPQGFDVVGTQPNGKGKSELNAIAELQVVEDSLEKTMKRYEARLLESLYPDYPSSRKLAKKLGMSHGAIALKLREYGISQKYGVSQKKEG